MRRRMTAAAVMGAHLLRRLRRASQQLVRQSRLADARRADEADGPDCRRNIARARRCRRGAGADGVHGHSGSDRSDLMCRPGDIVGEIGLVEHDDRSGAALARPSASKRSMRGRLKSPSGAVTMKTTSTFAAKSCGRCSPDALRTSALVRGSTASIVAGAVACRPGAARRSRRRPARSERCTAAVAKAACRPCRQLDRPGGDPKVAAMLADDAAGTRPAAAWARIPLAALAPTQRLECHAIRFLCRLDTGGRPKHH